MKGVIKIRLHMWELKGNYEWKGLDSRCPVFQSEEDITEHVLECNKGDKKFNLNDETGKEWGDSRNLQKYQQITQDKNKIYQKDRRKEKTVKNTKAKRRYKKTEITEEENTRKRCRRSKRQQKRQ